MTIQPRSLNSLFLLGLLLAAPAFADCSKEFEILERTKGDGYEFVKRELKDFNCKNTFEGKHFKIVQGTSEEPISFEHQDKTLICKAANVYHHLTLAREFWLKSIKSEYVGTLPQLTIRVDITNAFSSVRHFKNAEQEKNYNNAWTVPEGQTPRSAPERLKWGKEIWFNPMKRLESRKMVKSDGNNPVHESLVLLKDPVVEYSKNTLIYGTLGLIAAPALGKSKLIEIALQSAGTIAVIYGLVELTRHADHLFMEKYYFIDTAMVPDIIYHEYAHIAMSDSMKTVHSVPVIEGMADYFAALMVNRPKMYDSLKDFAGNTPRNAKSRMNYHPYLEGEWNSTSDFILSLLWRGKLAFEKLNASRAKKKQAPVADFNQLVFEAHKNLSENSDIAHDLTGALIQTCKSQCQNVRTGVNTLNQLFEDKGFN